MPKLFVAFNFTNNKRGYSGSANVTLRDTLPPTSGKDISNIMNTILKDNPMEDFGEIIILNYIEMKEVGNG